MRATSHDRAVVLGKLEGAREPEVHTPFCSYEVTPTVTRVLPSGTVSALLVSDREREYTVGLLRGHLLSGRLTTEEFEERVEEAWRARFAADLWRALRGLPVDGPPAPAPAKSRLATVSLVLGILGIGFLILSFGLLFALTLPLSATAWALGREARRSGVVNGRGAAAAGETLGVIGTVLSLLLFAGCAALVTGGF
jgi:Domain of unknown function (DUF1707)